jgi:hypothetical protein
MVKLPAPAATSAAVSQTPSQVSTLGCREAIGAATKAVTPIATAPQPESEVKTADLSMVSRINRMLSTAWLSIRMGPLWLERIGAGSGTYPDYTIRGDIRQVLSIIKHGLDQPPPF